MTKVMSDSHIQVVYTEPNPSIMSCSGSLVYRSDSKIALVVCGKLCGNAQGHGLKQPTMYCLDSTMRRHPYFRDNRGHLDHLNTHLNGPFRDMKCE